MGLDSKINYVKLEKNAKDCMRTSALLVLLIMLLPGTIITLFLSDAGLIRNIILAACWVLSIGYIIIVPGVRYERYRYYIDEEVIRVRQGFIFIKEEMVPMERLHKVSISQGPIARTLKLSTISVTTAGGDVKIKLLGEDTANQIAEVLKKKINDIAIMERESQ